VIKIRWTHEALLRLFEIEDFISQEGPDQAGKFVDQIIEHTESLADNPLNGPE
jgi:plasmid stabilization system protein ParE